jgi:hypothetical protein
MYTPIFGQNLSSKIKVHLLTSNSRAINFLFLVKAYDVTNVSRQLSPAAELQNVAY